jgi:adenine-specific DNA-methyltransferase
MALLEDLIKNIADPCLRSQIAGEVSKLKARKKFGLVFEEHLPEIVQLPGLAVRPGSWVAKSRDKTAGLFGVAGVVNGKRVTIVPERGGPEEIIAKDELVVVKRFGEPMYPALVPVDRLTRAPDKPYQTLINADNFHALQVLLHCYEGKVDVIYIDPPYNTGARDWKYNNDYVDKTDQYRHSKWLSMMKKRLELAKRLLRPDGVLIVTIDENEAHNLGLLLASLLPGYDQQVATIVINPGGTFGANLSSVHEYAIFCIPSKQDVIRGRPLTSEEEGEYGGEDDLGAFGLGRLRKRGAESLRKDRKSMFYAVYVDEDSLRPGDVGPEMPLDEEPSLRRRDGKLPIYPIDGKGIQRRWSCGRDTMLAEIHKGNVVARRNRKNVIQLYKKERVKEYRRLNTVWTAPEYSAGDYGSRIVNTILGKANAFPFPKSVYAVRDCIGGVVRSRPEAIILDFFAGSGTTMHAVMLLNAEDAGTRRCVLVTNNEVNDESLVTELHKQGFERGTPQFERHGICEAAAWPRVRACINGKREDGTVLPGDYLGGRPMSDGFEENVAYYRLDFLDPTEVKRGEMYGAILPILWMMAGARGDLELSKGSGKYHFPKGCPFCVLLREDSFKEFAAKLAERPEINHVFLVTDSVEAFYEMAAHVGKGKHCVQLYKSYLDNFKINMELKNAD